MRRKRNERNDLSLSEIVMSRCVYLVQVTNCSLLLLRTQEYELASKNEYEKKLSLNFYFANQWFGNKSDKQKRGGLTKYANTRPYSLTYSHEVTNNDNFFFFCIFKMF